LLDEWLPPAPEPVREEALAKLAKRYFLGHGPATLPDFERWAGLKTSDARAGLEMVKSDLRREELDGQVYWLCPQEPPSSATTPAVYLLPGFDEYILGYKDRQAVLEPQYAQKVVPGGNGVFMPTIISSGRVVGTWKRAVKKNKLLVTPVPFCELSPAETEGFAAAAASYGRFMEMPVEVASRA
jgi:hypothetical protein